METARFVKIMRCNPRILSPSQPGEIFRGGRDISDLTPGEFELGGKGLNIQTIVNGAVAIER
jgi:hypothetical protein